MAYLGSLMDRLKRRRPKKAKKIEKIKKMATPTAPKVPSVEMIKHLQGLRKKEAASAKRSATRGGQVKTAAPVATRGQRAAGMAGRIIKKAGSYLPNRGVTFDKMTAAERKAYDKRQRERKRR